jgi:hypothetical protein
MNPLGGLRNVQSLSPPAATAVAECGRHIKNCIFILKNAFETPFLAEKPLAAQQE